VLPAQLFLGLLPPGQLLADGFLLADQFGDLLPELLFRLLAGGLALAALPLRLLLGTPELVAGKLAGPGQLGDLLPQFLLGLLPLGLLAGVLAA
jgi:hypothetical protein